MGNSTFTSGIWKCSRNESDGVKTYVLDDDNRLIADTWANSDQDVGLPSVDEAIANARLIAAAPKLLDAARCALADLEGIMPHYEESGDREHPAWQTIKDLTEAINKATQDGR